MALVDILEGVGSALGKGAKAVGKGLGRLGEAYVEANDPGPFEERRQREQKLEDEETAIKANLLEQRLMQGGLTPEQNNQLIDALGKLYSHPSQAPHLMKRLHRIVHGDKGSTYHPNTPANLGGIFASQEAELQRRAEGAEKRKLANSLKLVEERGKFQGSKSKSPPLPGNQLPHDAIDPAGNPIPEAARNAGQSFVEFNGAWWPVAKPKPAFKKVKGHAVLVDPISGAILRDLGPEDAAKVTTRQTMQPGDDGQMHMVTLTSVTTPEGAVIDVEPQQGEQTTEQKPPAAGPKPLAGALHKPSTGAHPVQPKGTPVVAGFTALAHKKNATMTQNKADADVVEATKMVSLADQVAARPNDAINQKRLAVALERASAGRFTVQALNYVIQAGWGNTIEQWANNPTTGALPADVLRQLVDGAHENLKAARDAQAAAYGGGSQPASGDTIELVKDPTTGKLVPKGK